MTSPYPVSIAVLAFIVLGGVSAGPAESTFRTQNRPGLFRAEISGSITIRGAAANGLPVELASEEDGQESNGISTGSTDQAGQYHFSGLDPGWYRLKFVVPGCVSTGDDWHVDGNYQRVYLSNGSNGKDIDMVPAASISGRIVDADGAPVKQEDVTVERLVEENNAIWSASHAETDGDGGYWAGDLPPGHYILSVGRDAAEDRPNRGSVITLGEFRRISSDHYYEQTVYPGVALPLKDKTIELRAGQHLGGVNFSIGHALKSHSVSGRVVDAITGQPIPRCTLELGDTFSEGGYSSMRPLDPSAQGSDADGYFKLSGLLPGKFFLIPHLDGDTDLYPDVEQFEITDQDLTGIQLRFERGVTVCGNVLIDAGPAAGNEIASKLANLALIVAWSDGSSATVTKENNVHSDGGFEFRGLRPGRMELSISRLCDSEKYFSLVRSAFRAGAGERKKTVIAAQKGAYGVDSPYLAIEPGADGLDRLKVLVDYHNAQIKCHVDVAGGLVSPKGLSLSITSRDANGAQTSSSRDIGTDGDVYLDALKPGDYELSVCRPGLPKMSETKTVNLGRNDKVQISFIVKTPSVKGFQ